MDISKRESEELVGASTSQYAELGGLPDSDTIREEYRENLIRKVADSFDIRADELKDFLENEH